MMKCAIDAHEIFTSSRLPYRPYAADDLSAGLRRHPVAEALLRRHIQPNPEVLLFWLVYDVDRAGAAIDWQDKPLPPPNIVVTNPANGHAHLIYGLELPVCRTDAGSEKAIRYAAAVEHALRKALRADDGYAGLICKNPLHSHWRTAWIHPALYSLDELADWLTLPKKLPKRAAESGLGRNVTLFDVTRKPFYSRVRAFKATNDRQGFFAAVTAAAEARNAMFPDPLPASEVKALAKSVAKWTWRHFSLKGFSDWQARQGSKGGKASGVIRQSKVANLRVAAEALRDEGMTQRAIAEAMGVTERTIRNWLSE